AQVVLDSVHGRGHVGGAQRSLAPQPDEVILVVIGEAEHLVGYDVADVDDQIPIAGHRHGVQVNGHLPVRRTIGGFDHELGRNGADMGYPVLPVVNVD